MSTLPSPGNCYGHVSCTIHCNTIYTWDVNFTALSLVTNLRLIAHKYTSIYILKAQDTISVTAFTFVQSSLCCQHLWKISYILDTLLHVSLIPEFAAFSRLRLWDRKKLMVAQLRKKMFLDFQEHQCSLPHLYDSAVSSHPKTTNFSLHSQKHTTSTIFNVV